MNKLHFGNNTFTLTYTCDNCKESLTNYVEVINHKCKTELTETEKISEVYNKQWIN